MGRKLVPIEEINRRMPKNSLLTAIEYPEGRYISSSGQTKRMVKCECECGGECLALVGDLARGNPLSCGCLKRGRPVGGKKKKVKKLNKARKKKPVKKVASKPAPKMAEKPIIGPPVRKPGENALDFAARKNEWKKKQVSG
jgi:hypothetical protein